MVRNFELFLILKEFVRFDNKSRNMKIFLLLSLFVFYSNLVNSQTSSYHPFPHENAEWSLLSGIETFEPFDTIYYIQKFHTGGDSLIGTQSYIKYMSGTGVFSLFRDDTVNHKVYTLYDDGAILKDTLLYDFTLTVGSSISHSIEFLDYPDAIVTDVDSIFIEDNFRKRLQIKYTSIDELDSTYWIEGIGSTNGIQLGPHDAFEFPSYRKMICYSESPDELYSSLEDWYNCDSISIEQNPISIDQLFAEPITVYPNPVTDFLQIKSDISLLNSIIGTRLININGLFISEMKLEGSKLFFSDPNLPPGVYLLMIETYSNIYTLKIIKS